MAVEAGRQAGGSASHARHGPPLEVQRGSDAPALRPISAWPRAPLLRAWPFPRPAASLPPARVKRVQCTWSPSARAAKRRKRGWRCRITPPYRLAPRLLLEGALVLGLFAEAHLLQLQRKGCAARGGHESDETTPCDTVARQASAAPVAQAAPPASPAAQPRACVPPPRGHDAQRPPAPFASCAGAAAPRTRARAGAAPLRRGAPPPAAASPPR